MGDAALPRNALGHFAPRYDATFRAEVRVDFEGGDLTLGEIADKYTIAESTIHQWSRAEGWIMRQPHRTDPNDLVGRMLGRGRSDDTEEVIRNRMHVYLSETAPLLEHYDGLVVTVDGVGEVDEVNGRVLRALGR